MSKVAHYLQEHILGEVTASPEVRRHFSYDASILRMSPAIVAYPRNENDVRKIARFAWQLAHRGRVLPITVRGGGSNTNGAALSSGIVVVFPAHMNRILAIDTKKQIAVLEPGVTFDKLLQTLYTHGFFLPPYPASKHYSTIGGGIANNIVGEKSVKYGTLGDYIKRLRVVLANGEVIETGPLSKRELNKKMGHATLEGEIYRSLDGLIEENYELINAAQQRIRATRNAAGYNLFEVKNKSGFDLTPLIIGSQGTLGIITEVEVELESHNPISTMVMVSLDDLRELHNLLPQILALKPSMLDMVNKFAVHQVSRLNANQLKGFVSNPAAEVHLFIEFDDKKDANRKRAVKKLGKLVEKAGGFWAVASNPEDQEKIRKVRESITTILVHNHGPNKAVPVAEDVSLPIDAIVEFLSRVSEFYSSAGLVPAAWGQIGDGVIRMHPQLDLGQVGDRQKLFKVSDGIYRSVVELGGSITAGNGDGRVKAPYSEMMYGPDLYALMRQIKKIFDPFGILNPGTKTNSMEEMKQLIRGEYNLAHRHEHLPRS